MLAAQILAELGAASRFRRARQVVRLSGLDPSSPNQPTCAGAAGSPSKAHPSSAGPVAEAADHACRRTSPDHALYTSAKQRRGTQPATLTFARKITPRAYHVLADLEQAA